MGPRRAGVSQGSSRRQTPEFHLASFTPAIQPVFLAALAQTAGTNGLPEDTGSNGLGPWAQAQSEGQGVDDADDSSGAGLGGESFGLLDGGGALMGYAESCCPDNKTNNAYHVVTADGVGPTAILDGVTIKNGYADGSTPHHVGGGLLCEDSSPAIRHCIIECNAAGNGGGVSARTGGAPTITHCTIRYNWAISSAPTGSNGCGGMNIWLSDATVTDCTFYLNAGLGNRPGALVIGQCPPVITRCTFEENESPNKGGAASMWGNAASPQFVGCTFSENRVLNSGGIGGAVVVENGCPATFRDCTFTGNEAPGYGGGMAVTGSTSHANLVQCSFIDNTAPSGGGLSVQSGQATAVNCRFLGNQGGVGGGAFVVGGTTGFTNCVFSGNAVSGEMMALGGGMCVVGSGTATVTNCTFSGNTATAGEDALGGGVYVESATATITNTIAWGNLVNGSSTELAQIHKWYFSTFSLSFSCVQNWTSGGLGGSYNTASDPVLADPDGVDNTLGTADDDVRLTSGSPAIDTASDAAVPDDDFDLDRNGDTSEPLPLDLARGDRFLGTGPTVDMGAYEYLNTNGLGAPEPPSAGAPAPAPSGTAYIAFTYDALGRRIERTVDSGGASVEVTRYYYDGQNTVLEVDTDEAPRRTYMHGSQYIDERVLMTLPNGQEYYYLPRELYSVAALTDETGAIVEAATYDTYGQVAVYDGSAQAVEESPVGNPYYFTGRRLDLLPTASSPQPVSKQLYHYRARAYDPGNGRFMQRDPIPCIARNSYEYTGSNPADRVDPTGEFWTAAACALCVGAIAADVGGGAIGCLAGCLQYAGGNYGKSECFKDCILLYLEDRMDHSQAFNIYKSVIEGSSCVACGIRLITDKPPPPPPGEGPLPPIGPGSGDPPTGGTPDPPSNDPPKPPDKPGRSCEWNDCKPCEPPVGSLMYRVDLVPGSRPHRPFKGTHTNHYMVGQSPAPKCQCFLIPLPATDGASPYPGEIPVKPVGGGGPK